MIPSCATRARVLGARASRPHHRIRRASRLGARASRLGARASRPHHRVRCASRLGARASRPHHRVRRAMGARASWVRGRPARITVSGARPAWVRAHPARITVPGAPWVRGRPARITVSGAQFRQSAERLNPTAPTPPLPGMRRWTNHVLTERRTARRAASRGSGTALRRAHRSPAIPAPRRPTPAAAS